LTTRIGAAITARALLPAPREETAAVPPPLFLITCSRSYSSLVCAMLGQHPEMYGLPELNLAVADRVSGLIRMALSLRPTSLHGLIRAIAELEFGGQTEETVAAARQWLRERADWTTDALFQHCAARVAPRVLVEKSPTATVLGANLERLRRAFPEARFLHLTRHPRPTCRSILTLVRATDEKTGRSRADSADPERQWRLMNGTAFAFMANLPPGQGMRIRGEDLLSDPDTYLRQICWWLEVRDDDAALAAMKRPEESPFACIGPEPARFGNDPNFLRDPAFRWRPIPPASLDGPLAWGPDPEAGFSAETRALAGVLGYR